MAEKKPEKRKEWEKNPNEGIPWFDHGKAIYQDMKKTYSKEPELLPLIEAEKQCEENYRGDPGHAQLCKEGARWDSHVERKKRMEKAEKKEERKSARSK
jgi:hypothetical protein